MAEASDSESDSDNAERVVIRSQKSDRGSGLQTLSILGSHIEEKGKGKKTVWYVVNVKVDGDGWVVVKRYRQFEGLHGKLCKRYNSKLPLLPIKKIKKIHNHVSSYFVEKRRALLDNYCKKLLLNRQIGQSQEVLTFFSQDVDPNREFQYEIVPAFPTNQEVSDVSIPKYRKMTDHILYTIDVTNKATSSNWIVLKRFTQFRNMDKALRKSITEDVLDRLPKRPKRKSKIWRDHMNAEFVEERRVMMENYLRRILCIPQVAHNENFLTFLGVGTETEI